MASLIFWHVCGDAFSMGMWEMIWREMPAERMSRAREGPRVLSFERMGVEMRWRAASVGWVDVPRGIRGERYDSSVAMN